MDDSMRAEYPGMLANLQPLQAAHALNDRVKRISKLNIEIADWLQERRKIEDQYVLSLRKLSQFRVPNAQSELGTFQPQWDKIIQSADAMAMAHHLFAVKIDKEVEQPLRNFHTRNEMQNIVTIQANLQGMAKEVDDAQKKSVALSKKGGKASAAKMDQASQRLDAATGQWESQAPFIFETLQALDETRMNHLRDVLTQYGTYEGEQAQQIQADAESVLNSLLDYNTANEIKHFVEKTTTGKPKIERQKPGLRTSMSGASSGAAPTSSVNVPPPPPVPEDDRSEHSGFKEGEVNLRSRIGTMFGRRRQSIHGGFGQLSPAKGPFSRNIKSSHGILGLSPRASSSNLGEQGKLSSLTERPDTSDGLPRPSETNEKKRNDGPNGIGGDAASDDFVPKHVNGGSAAASAVDIANVVPPPGPPPSHKESEKDAEGFSVPSASLDPISAAEKEATAEEAEPAFKLSIQKEPVAEEDPEERQAALSKFSNSLSAMGTAAARRSGTVRGRRDVRNSIYVPSSASPELTTENPFPPSVNLHTTTSKPSVMASLTSESSIAGTSDTQSIRSSNSLGSMAHFQHPDMHETGLNSSIIETVSAIFDGGDVKSVKVNGEIAFSFNATDPSSSQTHQLIRLNNFSILESIGPNRIFVTNTNPEQPDQFTLDLSHVRQRQATVGFSYRLHIDAETPPTEHLPILFNPAWKPQGDKLGLLLQYKLNPAFKFAASDGLQLHNLVLFATYEGNSSGAQTKPSGTHLKDKHLVYWRLGDVTLKPSQEWQKIVCRIVGEQNAEPKPGAVEARFEFSPQMTGEAPEGLISVSKLEEGKGKEVELNDDDPFADASGSEGEGRWVDVPTVRKVFSGKFEAK